MGESESKLKKVVLAIKELATKPVDDTEPMNVATPGGRIEVRWDTRENATTMGQLTFFAEFLNVAGLFENWVQRCPLHYTSPNAPKVRDVLGTWMLSILDGQRRYVHVASLRGDAVAPHILKMSSIVGDESLRRGLALIAPAPKASHSESEQQAQQKQLILAEQWMSASLKESVQHALDTPWILDVDTTIKTLFGNQRGAEVSYNPHKPGRPSHSIHTYWIANLRLVLDARVQGGKSHSAANTLPGLVKLIVDLPEAQRPALVRGDCAFGNEKVMCELEGIAQSYLFKLRQTANVKRLLTRLWRHRSWCDVGQGWEACEDNLTLTGWTRSRRVIVMRHAVRGELVAELPRAKRGSIKSIKNTPLTEQTNLCFIDENAPEKLWEYAVLVTNTNLPVVQMGQLYRDRADCENGFDELKNQWGWGGYSTQDMERCNLSARAVALIYNWWSWYVRLAHPEARLEALTSRPLLLAAVGYMTEHAGKTRVLLSVTHAAVTKVKAFVANVRTGLEHIRTTTPQLSPALRWRVLVRYIVDKILSAKRQNNAKTTAPPTLATG